MHDTVHSKPGPPADEALVRPLRNAEPAKVHQPKPQEYNPYLAGRLAWDERYGDLVSRAQTANRFAIISVCIALLETIAFLVIFLRPPKVIVVAVNSAGQFIGSGSSDQSVTVTEGMKSSALSEWVSNMRLVTPDSVSQRGAIEKVYAMISSGSSAQSMISDFYRAEPPQTRALNQTVHVEVNSVLPTSDKTYEVEWIEATRDLQGKMLYQQRWKGAFSYVVSSSPPSDERFSRLNPIGLYITEARWSKVL